MSKIIGLIDPSYAGNIKLAYKRKMRALAANFYDEDVKIDYILDWCFVSGIRRLKTIVEEMIDCELLMFPTEYKENRDMRTIYSIASEYGIKRVIVIPKG